MAKSKKPTEQPDPSVALPHLNADAFKAAIEHTAGKTGFSHALIEKDYYCSVVLRFIYQRDDHGLHFKGGTALNKIHAGFYRLSEDLDFSISISPSATRTERSKAAAPLKELIGAVPKDIFGVTIKKPPAGANQSTQYLAEFEYVSCLGATTGAIKVEVGLREELVQAPIRGKALTLVEDPYRNTPLILPFEVSCLSQEESYAEKIRAALTRENPAIRDIFDFQHGLEKGMFNPENAQFKRLINQKLKVPGNGAVDISEEREKLLRLQIETELRPVLRPADFKTFKFDEAWGNIKKVASQLT